MKRSPIICFAVALFSLHAIAASETEVSVGRPWTVQDSISVRYFIADYAGGTFGRIDRVTKDDIPYVASPSGTRFFFITRAGDLATDSVLYELRVYDTRTVRKALDVDGRSKAPAVEPMRRIQMRSPYSGTFDAAGIAKAQWENDSLILFVGVDSRPPHRLFRLNVDTGKLSAITGDDRDVRVSFGSTFTVHNDTALFQVEEAKPWTPLDAYPMTAIRGDELQQLNDPHQWLVNVYHSRRAGAATLVARVAEGGGVPEAAISPDENWAVLVYPPRDAIIPQKWLQYEVKPEKGFRFMLVDLNTGATRPLLNAPAGTVTQAGRGRRKPFAAFWSPDSRHVILYNTALPLDEDAEARKRMSYIVDYAVGSGRWSILEPMAAADGTRVAESGWSVDRKSLLITKVNKDGMAVPGTAVEWNGSGWTRPATSKSEKLRPLMTVGALPPSLRVTLAESFNEPPIMKATYGNHMVTLTPPDPALKGIWRAKGEDISWREPDGRTHKGWLMKPRGSMNPGGWPLVIQATSDPIDVFRPDGANDSGAAAQALVAQGFAVVVVDFYDDAVAMSPKEGPTHVQRVDAIVESLAARGLVDASRVGLAGFSRTGFLTYYIITHPGRTRLACAAVFDSITASYGEYVLTAGYGDIRSSAVYERQYGSGSFWQNKAGWLDAPAFNVERVVTPVLFSSVARWPMLETIGAFRYTRRPFEYLHYPDAAHVLQRPRQREAAMQATVDWMAFWILGKEADGHERDDRFERWRKIRTEWAQTQRAEQASTRSTQ